ncbi:hypothetical protein DVA76_16820 [Acinetobacter baumannii]|nr:hypothetical protein DVA81_17400 [Acinetobacter baumannii]RCU38835.1 hypothetical protein DVA76_16820 [Acinetobacter baumannii]
MLTVVSEDNPHEGPSSVDLQPISTAIILEGGIIMDHIKKLASGSLSVIWAYICFAFGLPKMHGKYTQLHSDCDAWTGKENLPPKLLTLKNSLLG